MTSATYFITPATAEDCEELSRLVNSAYRGESSRRGWTTEADYLEGMRTSADVLRQDLKQPGQRILCLREHRAGEILGCVFLQDFDDSEGPGVYLGMLTVRPDLQARGLGRILLDHVELLAQDAGQKRITMTVIQIRDTLIAWYERRGFRRTEKTKPFPYDNPIFGIPQRPDLHFIVMEKKLNKVG